MIEGESGPERTAVALQRVASLGHEQLGHTARLSHSAVLAIGFDHGGSVGAVDATLGELFPGVRTAVEDTPEARRIKGGLDMIDVLAAAVADRQRVPNEPIPITMTDVEVAVDAALAGAARHRARATGRPHNVARAVFVDELLDGLAGRAVDRIGDGWLGPGDTALRAHLAANVRRELAEHEKVPVIVEELWPCLTPQRLLADLFGSRERLAAVTTDVDALYRAVGDTWTVSDVPLLDEAAGLLDHRDTGRTYDHVIVDDAQELSEMDWRCVMRRCPTRSMTIVGDLTRRRSPAGARSWAAMLDRYTAGLPVMPSKLVLSGSFDEVADQVRTGVGVTGPVPPHVDLR